MIAIGSYRFDAFATLEVESRGSRGNRRRAHGCVSGPRCGRGACPEAADGAGLWPRRAAPTRQKRGAQRANPTFPDRASGTRGVPQVLSLCFPSQGRKSGQWASLGPRRAVCGALVSPLFAGFTPKAEVLGLTPGQGPSARCVSPCQPQGR